MWAALQRLLPRSSSDINQRDAGESSAPSFVSNHLLHCALASFAATHARMTVVHDIETTEESIRACVRLQSARANEVTYPGTHGDILEQLLEVLYLFLMLGQCVYSCQEWCHGRAYETVFDQ